MCPRVNPLTWAQLSMISAGGKEFTNLGCTVHNKARRLPLLLRRIGCQMSDKVFLEVQMVATTAWN